MGMLSRTDTLDELLRSLLDEKGAAAQPSRGSSRETSGENARAQATRSVSRINSSEMPMLPRTDTAEAFVQSLEAQPSRGSSRDDANTPTTRSRSRERSRSSESA